MEKLTGYGAPHNHLVGKVGQHYEDLNTGDIYECRIAQKYSPTHGWPVGGYVWELRAKGEDIKEIYGSSGQSSGTALPVVELTTAATAEGADLTAEEVAKIEALEGLFILKCTIEFDGTLMNLSAPVMQFDMDDAHTYGCNVGTMQVAVINVNGKWAVKVST